MIGTRPGMTVCLLEFCRVGQRRACAVPTVSSKVGTLRFAHPTAPGTFFRFPCYLPALSNRGLEMSENYIIEIGSQAAGIVVRNPDGYRFFAATHRFNPLEGQLFHNAREAERAVRRLANGELTVAA